MYTCVYRCTHVYIDVHELCDTDVSLYINNVVYIHVYTYVHELCYTYVYIRINLYTSDVMHMHLHIYNTTLGENSHYFFSFFSFFVWEKLVRLTCEAQQKRHTHMHTHTCMHACIDI